MIQDARVCSMMVEHDRVVPMIEDRGDPADYSREKLDHGLIVYIIIRGIGVKFSGSSNNLITPSYPLRTAYDTRVVYPLNCITPRLIGYYPTE